MIIGIAGESEHGKDEIGLIIDELWSERNYKGSKTSGRINARFYDEFTMIKFADGINKVIQSITGFPIEYIMNKDNYDVVITWLGKTIRDLKQIIGEGMKPLLGDDIWLKVSFTRVRAGANTKVTDIRFPVELDFLRPLPQSILFFVERPGHISSTLDDKNKNHKSETAIRTLDKSKFDYVIINDGTRAELKTKVRKALESNMVWKLADSPM